MPSPSDIEFGIDTIDLFGNTISFDTESVEMAAETVRLDHPDVTADEGPDIRADRFGFAPESGSRSIEVHPAGSSIRVTAGSDETTNRIDIDADSGGIDLYHQSLSVRTDTGPDGEVNSLDVSGSELGRAGWGHTMTFHDPEGDESAIIDTSTRTGPDLRLLHDGQAPVSADEPVGPTLAVRTREHGSIVLETDTDDTTSLELQSSTGAGVELAGGEGPADGTVGVVDAAGNPRIGLLADAGDTRSAIQLYSSAGGITAARGGGPVATIDESGLFALGSNGQHGRVRLDDESGDARVQLTAGHPGQVDTREETTGVFANGGTGTLVLSGNAGQLTIERDDRIAAALTSNANFTLGSGVANDPGAPGTVTVKTAAGADAATIEGDDATLTVGPTGGQRQGPVKDESDRTSVRGGEPGTVSVRDDDGRERVGLSADTAGPRSDPGAVSLRNAQGDLVCYVRVSGDAVEFVDAAASGQPVVFRIRNGRVEAPNQNDV